MSVTRLFCAALLIAGLPLFLQAGKIPPGGKIPWQGQNWDITGVNVPWYAWGCDFGCGAGGGVVGNNAAIDAGFATVKNAGLHMARWWVFPGNNIWQIQTDGTGAPTGMNPAIYQDFDAALALAEKHDLYYNFVLFSAATHPPRSWITNPAHRAKLAEALSQLFARYGDHPRILSWETFNEPEFQIWNNEIDQASVVATHKAIADAVHANSIAYVTVGSAFVDGTPMWVGQGTDYYSPHWYDYMQPGAWCLRCRTYDDVRQQYNLDGPVVIGEYYGGLDVDALQRLEDWRAKGYAGGWAWSLFWDNTNDKLRVDLNAARTYTGRYADVGPKAGGAPPGRVGDMDGDDDVDLADLSYFLRMWGTTDATANINKLGAVDVTDLSLFLNAWTG